MKSKKALKDVATVSNHISEDELNLVTKADCIRLIQWHREEEYRLRGIIDDIRLRGIIDDMVHKSLMSGIEMCGLKKPQPNTFEGQ
jgi:hypothetical protein